MRAGLFVLIFALLVIGTSLTGASNPAFVLFISAAIAAILASVLTRGGRQSLRRIGANLGQGWSRSQS